MEHRARPLLFSTSHPPSVTATCIAALDLLAGDAAQCCSRPAVGETRGCSNPASKRWLQHGISQTPITP